VSSPFDSLGLDPGLACEFLAVFARFEFALKASGYANGYDAKAAWDRYSRAIDGRFARLDGPELAAAAEYLLSDPSRKQVVRSGELTWESTALGGAPRAQRVLLMVRRVRNNLSHGGKFPAGGTRGDPGRDQALVQHSLVVLRACLPLDPSVEAAFSG
jgi:hypothetical protein